MALAKNLTADSVARRRLGVVPSKGKPMVALTMAPGMSVAPDPSRPLTAAFHAPARSPLVKALTVLRTAVTAASNTALAPLDIALH